MLVKKYFFLLGLLLCSLGARAEDVVVVLSGVTSDKGSIIALLCKSDEGFPNQCKLKEVVDAKSGAVKIKFSNVEKGVYAFAAFHDENKNKKLDIGSPSANEGLAFSNNSMGKSGPPSFKQASFGVKENVTLVVKMVRIGG